MKKSPPRWADRFLEWYCKPGLLEAIQGDAYELFDRRARKNPRRASFLFLWDVLRFLRWKNIRKPNHYSDTITAAAMIQNIIRVAFRNFMRQPVHSLLNISGLAAGFACSILITLWLIQETSFDRFHKDAGRIFNVLTHVKADDGYQTFDVASAAIDVSSIPEVTGSVSVSTGDRWPHELCLPSQNEKDPCIYLKGVYSDSSFFRVFSFPILQGDRHPLKGLSEIVITQHAASTLFGSVNPIGKTIKVDGRHDVSVVAVVQDPPVTSSLKFDFIMPFAILKKLWGVNDQQFNANYFKTYIKTSTDADVTILTAKLNNDRVVTKSQKAERVSYQAFPFSDWHLHSKFEGGKNTGGRIEYVRLFSGIAILIVLMAIINFINMTTARASTRAKEIGIRKVTGAFRSGIIAQFMGESFLTVLAAFTLAVLVTLAALPYFNRLLPEPVEVQVYSGMVPFYLGAFLLVVAFLAGIYPAFVLSSFQPVKILKDRFSGSMAGSNRLRKSLLIVQLTVSLGIIMFTGVIYWQLNFVSKKDLGFDRLNMVRLEPTYKLLQKIDAFKNELSKSPYILGVTASNLNPLAADGGNTGVQWPGKKPDTRIAFSTIGCTYEFPNVFGIKILEGRDFLPESQDSVNNEVLVSKEAVKTMGLANPIGEHIRIGDAPCVIIGVINDFHTGSLHDQRLPVILHRISIFHTGGLYIKYKPGETKNGMLGLEKAYATLEPAYPIKYFFQDDVFNSIYQTEQTASRLAILFTIITLIIAFIGIAGLATFNIVRKTKEIGVRRVFGASVPQVLQLLTREFSLVMYAALLIATPLTWYLANRWLQTFAYHIPMPWWWYGVSFLTIASLTIGIICLQAFKTVIANPTQALRNE